MDNSKLYRWARGIFHRSIYVKNSSYDLQVEAKDATIEIHISLKPEFFSSAEQFEEACKLLGLVHPKYPAKYIDTPRQPEGV